MEKGVFDVDYHLVGYSDASQPSLEVLGEGEFPVECFQFVGSHSNLSTPANGFFKQYGSRTVCIARSSTRTCL